MTFCCVICTLSDFAVRCLVFIFFRNVQRLQPEVQGTLNWASNLIHFLTYHHRYQYLLVVAFNMVIFTHTVCVCVCRLSNISYLICRVLPSLQHMHFWSCFGLKFITRQVLICLLWFSSFMIVCFVVWFCSSDYWLGFKCFCRHVLYPLMDWNQLSIQLMLWCMLFRWRF